MFDNSLLSQLASWDSLRGNDGLLGGIGNQVADGFTNNRNAMMLGGMGLLSGEGPQAGWGNAMKGYAAGASIDRARARSQRTAAQAAKRQEAYRNLFARRPDLAQAAALDEDL